MPDRARLHTVGVLAYTGAQPAAVHGLTDLLTIADRLHAERGGRPARLEVVRLEDARPLRSPRSALTAIVVPPSVEGAPSRGAAAPLAAWLLARHGEGTLLCSVCAGGFVLAETGLLSGRPATTHWALRDLFVERFPDVLLDTDRMIVDEGDVMTAGGLMAWIDLGLRLVERYLGATTMLATARYFLVDPGGREQRFYKTFAPPMTHGDAAILKVQRWLQARSGERSSVPMMARKAGLGERTFLRRFVDATALRPTEYVQHLRIHQARDLLELKSLTIEEVAGRVGYADANAFRKIFVRLMGLSPGEYRRRFAVTRGSAGAAGRAA